MIKEETLDPEDRESMRTLGHKMLDDVIDYHKSSRASTMYQLPPEKIINRLNERVPKDQLGAEKTYQELSDLLEYTSRL